MLAVLVAAGMVMAACGKSKGSSVTATTVALTTTAAPPSTVALNLALVPGGGKATCAAGLSIDFFGALTGDSAALGINENNGVKLAVDQFDAVNPGCQVKKGPGLDSQGSPDQAPALAQKAVSDPSLVALIGPAFSGESKVADPIFDQAGLPIITASATNPKLSTNGWKIFHRAVGNDNAQGPAAARLIVTELKAHKVAVLDDASEYGKGIADIVRNKIKAAPAAAVAYSDEIDPKATDYSSNVTRIKAANPDAVFFGGYYQAAGVLVKQMRDSGVTAIFVGPDGVEDPGFVKAAGQAAAEGALLTAPAAPIETVPGGPEFKATYKAAFGVDTGLYSAEAFDSTNAVLTGIAAGNTTRKAINTYLSTRLAYTGLTKTLRFGPTGELAGKVTVYAYKVQNGVIKGYEAIAG